mmetsp:Transcript_18655/g.44180  ORF Transcript_18655/g.44180 Transcript_18655/m.44180 type:complete len:442 (-) Transcript_18655:53-1378(-)|eukprot:CAMPEP_0181446488 /NCGR_PEP_ID=MMETSP1110-20121109/26131_1 /TAXON_ID=174948 /ORGANISM="Symbiodinium sp., Strain CCMP421" /LENGTH=441 /DNA_ID=CAMNT_0023570569 /DNA_START=78 /DNA_END=1403 /DNA_ORIENTATION=+
MPLWLAVLALSSAVPATALTVPRTLQLAQVLGFDDVNASDSLNTSRMEGYVNADDLEKSRSGLWLGGMPSRLPFHRGMSRHKVKHVLRSVRDYIQDFFMSARAVSWATFFIFWAFLLAASMLIFMSQDLKYWWQHLFTMSFWVFLAIVYCGIVGAQEGDMMHNMSDWASGYVLELILSMENIFIYEMILASFHVPKKLALKALYITSFFQMFFQMWLFMFVAKYLEAIRSLPYLLGAWLVYLGIETLREDDNASFDPESALVFKALKWALGDRLVFEYSSNMLVTINGKLCVTMLVPATMCLIVVMFVMEVDVTLAKIETIDSNFIGWTSSVFVAFALPDLYIIVKELFRRFYLLGKGISVLLVVFGTLLLVHDEVAVSDTTEVLIMLSIVLISMAMSLIMELGNRRGESYDSEPSHEKAESDAASDEITPPAAATVYSTH